MKAEVRKLRLRIEDALRSKRMSNEKKLKFIKPLRIKLKMLGYTQVIELGPEGHRGAISALRKLGEPPLPTFQVSRRPALHKTKAQRKKDQLAKAAITKRRLQRGITTPYEKHVTTPTDSPGHESALDGP